MLRLSPVLKSMLDRLHCLEYACSINYLRAAHLMDTRNLPVLATHFHQECQHEFQHMVTLQEYMMQRQEQPCFNHMLTLDAFLAQEGFSLVPSPAHRMFTEADQATSLQDIFKNAFLMEESTLQSYGLLLEKAHLQKDYNLSGFLDPLLREQVQHTRQAEIMKQRAQDMNQENGYVELFQHMVSKEIKHRSKQSRVPHKHVIDFRL